MSPFITNQLKLSSLVLFLLSLVIQPRAIAAPGDLDPLDLNVVGLAIYATAEQPDGKTIIAGGFSSLLGVARGNIARLNADGTLDTGFDPKADGSVRSVLVQKDGKIVIGGQFTSLQPNGAPSPTTRNRIARLNADGTLDTGFDPNVDSEVLSLALQTDGKILLGGRFNNLQPNGSVTITQRRNVARVNADGTLDASFNPNPDSNVFTVAVQGDGKILLGGLFTTLQPSGAPNPTTRNRIARVNTDGTLDTDFDPRASAYVSCLAVQADGKILLGGVFSTLQPNGASSPTTRNRIARINSDGTLDTGFDPNPDSAVSSLGLQADGKIVLGGSFTSLRPNGATSFTTRLYCARVNADGTLDTGFASGTDGPVYSVSVQEEGKILIGGFFTSALISGGPSSTTRNRFVRLVNDQATQTLSTPDTTQVTWTRGGSSPEVSQVTFEQSTDSGANWTELGSGTRVATTSNWQLTGLTLAPTGQLRARGRTSNGDHNGSSGLVEHLVNFNLIPTVAAMSPNSGSASGGTNVTITGTNFIGATDVTIGGVPATSFSVINATTLTATTPAHAAGTASVLVTTPAGSNEPNTLYTYLSNNADLSGLSLATATINEPFAANTVAYTSSVPNGVTSVTVTPTVAQADATIQARVGTNAFVPVISGSPSASLALAVGANTIEVKVTAHDGTTSKSYTVVVTRAVGPEIAILGNGVEISAGDATPSLVDDTHFGTVAVTSGVSTHTFSITNTSPAALALTGTPIVSIGGIHAADFQVSLIPTSPIAGNSGTTFQVTFDPSEIGLRTAVVSIPCDDLNETPYTFAIAGWGRLASQASQTLAFTAPPKLFLAESPFTLEASSNSGLPVVYTVISGPASVTGSVLTLTGVGTVKVRASQPGDAGFLAATPVERTITVSANPTTLTLTNLSQTFTGTPRPITVLGATGAAVTYNGGLTIPTNAGSYSVKAVLGGISRTGTLVISKAPLFVTPDDQRKFAGQVNPVLTFSYQGFLGSDNAVKSVDKAPTITTTATAASAGGLYPITTSGGSSTNYFFIHQRGTMEVETFAGAYEALLAPEGSQRPSAKLELTVAASSKTFTAKLTTPKETAALSLTGVLTTNTASETAAGTATLKRGANTYLVEVTLPLTGDFAAEAKQNAVSLGKTLNGKRLLTLAKGQTLSYTGTHSALLAPATGGSAPAGAGWAVATIDAKGLLKLAGRLADGTSLTASLAADSESDPGYRLFIQPYTPARTGAFLAGAFELLPHPDHNGRRFVAFEDGADLTWEKAPRPLDASYRAGFGPVDTRFTLDPWLPPVAAKGIVPAITLAQRLGLSGPTNPFTVQHSTISSSSFADLPVSLTLNATTNAVSVTAPVTTPANATKWKVTITPTTGAFVGSFELIDGGKKRSVPFTGIMRQPPTTDTSDLIGDGNFQLPSLFAAPNNEILSGEVGFEK